MEKKRANVLKDQCVGFREDLMIEMEYNIQNYVFICALSPENKNRCVFHQLRMSPSYMFIERAYSLVL